MSVSITNLVSSEKGAVQIEHLENALNYINLGWPVLPLHYIEHNYCHCGKNQCNSPGKHPLILNGLKGATTNKDKVTEWWTKTPQANIGILTGKKSGLVVLDIDPQHGGNLSLEDLKFDYGELPPTIQVFTGGGGTHFYFRYPDNGVIFTRKNGHVVKLLCVTHSVSQIDMGSNNLIENVS